ncbi:hypothetical protein CXF85_07895 [Colwellia sp. 75C3]|nr:hypothetical protein CXF85_07895 [Colwellia sp. 75C3]
MITHKAFALLYFLFFFCFLSTAYAQPCLAESNLAPESQSQFSLEDIPESDALLNSNFRIKQVSYTSLLIDITLLEDRKNHTLPCCNRGPPPHYFINQQSIP